MRNLEGRKTRLLKPIKFTKVNGEVDLSKVEDETLRICLQHYSSPESVRNVYGHFARFYDWVQASGPEHLRGLTLSQLVKYQAQKNLQATKSATNGARLVDRRELLYCAIRFANSGEGWRMDYRVKLLTDVCAIFQKALEDAGGFPTADKSELKKLTNGVAKVVKKLDFDALRRIYAASNTQYRAVFSVMVASGMGLSEVVQFSTQGVERLREALESPIHRDPDIIKVTLDGRKLNRAEFFTYVGGFALKNLRAWLINRDHLAREYERETGRPYPSTVFVSSHGVALSKTSIESYWNDVLERLGMKKAHLEPVPGETLEDKKSRGSRRRTGLNPHLIRSIYRTRWAVSGANENVGEYFMGHTIDALGYNQVQTQTDFVIFEYLTALRWLDLDQNDPDESVKMAQKLATEQTQTIHKLQENMASMAQTIAHLSVSGSAVKTGLTNEDINNIAATATPPSPAERELFAKMMEMMKAAGYVAEKPKGEPEQ